MILHSAKACKLYFIGFQHINSLKKKVGIILDNCIYLYNFTGSLNDPIIETCTNFQTHFMRKLFVLILIIASTFKAFPQGFLPETVDNSQKLCASFGILQGGGSLVGADLEVLVYDRIGLQAGAGFMGYGAALNIHFKPVIKSSFLSLTYWHQGVGDRYTQSMFGPTFVFRGKKWLTAQIGLGYALEQGPAWPEDREQPTVMLLYSIGGYIPW